VADPFRCIWCGREDWNFTQGDLCAERVVRGDGVGPHKFTPEGVSDLRDRAGLENPKRSVLQDWVMKLPLREQGTLLTCIRGCDLVPKLPLDSIPRRIVSSLRYAIMVCADVREIDSAPGCFMTSQPPYDEEWKVSELEHYPLHWVTHIMHASEVIAYRHPEDRLSRQFGNIYHKIVRAWHLYPETYDQFEERLSEDRIVSGEIVS